jgi:hypothetical protein
MNVPMVGLAAPNMVFSCTITNNSYDNIRVLILYTGGAREGMGVDQEVANAEIPLGGTFQAEERLMDHGSFQTRKEIVGIEVTRANGQTQKLTAPFVGVRGLQVDWPFVIDDWQIHSGNNNQ